MRRVARDLLAGSVGAFWASAMALHGPGAKVMFYAAFAVMMVSGAMLVWSKQSSKAAENG